MSSLGHLDSGFDVVEKRETPFHYRMTLAFTKGNDSYGSLQDDFERWVPEQEFESFKFDMHHQEDAIMVQITLEEVDLVTVSKAEATIKKLISGFHFSPALEEFSERVKNSGIDGFTDESLIPVLETGDLGPEIKRRNMLQSLVGCVFLYEQKLAEIKFCLLYTSPSPRDLSTSRMPSSA